jgi:hypothetical protein
MNKTTYILLRDKLLAEGHDKDYIYFNRYIFE